MYLYFLYYYYYVIYSGLCIIEFFTLLFTNFNKNNKLFVKKVKLYKNKKISKLMTNCNNFV
jgi:hypothetical protein